MKPRHEKVHQHMLAPSRLGLEFIVEQDMVDRSWESSDIVK